MAVAGNLSTLTEELDSLRFKSLQRRVEDHLKFNSYPRTDQFAVANQLDGLQEKFQVLNRDELADTLRTRLTELEVHRDPWLPEVLSLFLQLADRPAQLSKIDRIEIFQPKSDAEPLSWTDLDVSGSAYCEEDIWEPVDFGAESSEDDFSSVSSDSFQSRSPQDDSTALDGEYVIPDDVFSSVEDEEALVKSIESAQFWRDENYHGISREGVSSRVLTELQVVRETIFMLQGLPTSLFWVLDGGIEVDRRYALKHLSNESLSSILRSLSSVGSQIDVLRRFIKTPQTISYVQTFHRGIEKHLQGFDLFLSNQQLDYLSNCPTTSVSILQLSDDVRRESRLLLLLAHLVADVQRKDVPVKSVRCLDSLYDMVCMTQATGDDNEFMHLAKLLFSCFETYARPIRTWMETGRLEDSTEDGFFILDNHNENDLRTLWHGWYTLDSASRLLNAPKFIRPVARKVFITGKSAVFLRQLNVTTGMDHPRKTSLLAFEDVFPADSSSTCLSFSALLETAFGRIVDESHSFTSTLLRKALGQQCGLWSSLKCLEHVYLCKDMSVFETIDYKIFDLIDRGRGTWSDRFLLTELAQSSLSALPFVDPSRLIVRSSPDKISRSTTRSKSVTMLQTISFDYILPWPVANIINKDAILGYQRISTFLMQIRRARHMIVKQRLQYSDPSDRNRDDKSNALSYGLRHNMLWYLNTLYSHMTDFVISTSSNSLRKSLSAASDVDAMIAVHRAYMSSLEDQCLLSKNLYPLHRATITLLDLCVSFADLQSMRHGTHKRDPTKILYTHSNSQINSAQADSYLSDDEDDEDEVYDSDDADANAPDEFLHDTHYVDRLKDIKDQFNRLVAFMVAGLKGVGRVDGQLSWEILAEKLEWRKEWASN
ncbi:hypothetical protein FE257_004028 [Aspergillus nanangensis]|uniref:Spindle pole body component n=1 Tax=Aspergillus nanangensis TaxID=2582783 RepID=A0AAD4CRV1_ASPNN|nr:hypothetical protein FE257_004028 [Aspergillus nanangensis]